MRLLRFLVLALAALALLVLLAVGGLWWWTGTEGSARWALEQVARREPAIATENVTGSLRGGVRAGRVTWSKDGLSVEAREVEVAWQPLSLLQRWLRLERVRAASVRIEDRRPPTGQRPQPPASLALPLRVSVDELAAGRIDVVGRTPVEVTDLAASYGYDGATHRMELRNVRVLDGHYRGTVELGDGGELPLQARLQGRIVAPVPGGSGPVPLVFEAQAKGPIRALEAQAQLQAEPGGPTSSATRATVTARVAPFEEQPVPQAQATFEALDLGALWARAPHTLLSGHVGVQPDGAQAWRLSGDVRNALPGPWDRRRLPAERVRFEGDWRLPARVLVRDLEAQVGGGRVRARGQWQGEEAWTVDGTISRVDPAAVHGMLAAVPLDGRIALRGEGTVIAFDTALEAAGAVQGRTELDAAVSALELRSLRAKGRWADASLSLPLLEVRTADARLDAAVDARPSARSGRGRVDLEAPGLRLRGVGSLAATAGGGNVRATLASVRDAQRWLMKLPGMPAAVGAPALAGRADLQLAWQGGWDDPSVEGTLTLPQLQPETGAGEAAPWRVRDLTARLDGRLADARLDLKGVAQAGERELNLAATGRGGQRRGGAWQGQVATLEAALRDAALGPGPWRVALRRPVDVHWQAGRLETGSGEAVLTAPVARAGTPSSAQLAWEPVRWEPGRLRTAGTLSGLPMAWAELFGGPQLAGSALSGDLVFDARWDVTLAESLRARASLVRRAGDVSVIAETVDGQAARVQAGVREARLAVEADGEAVTATARWESERAGTADARLATRLARDGGAWTWPEAAPLSGTVKAQLPRLGVWSLLAPPGWRLRGSLAADVSVAGTRADPALAGTLRADDLALRSVVDGIALQDGRLRARLDGRRLLLEEFLLRGAGANGGTVTGTGEGRWENEGLQVRVAARLDRLRAASRADRELVVSGDLAARMDAKAAELRGDVRVDRARIVLPDEAAPRLGDDVVVRNLPPGVALGKAAERVDRDERGGSARALLLAVNVDLGNDFRVQGRGIETRLAGTLQVGGDSVAEPRLAGTIRTVGGEYRAYGQRLDIERGVLRFTGPADNPSLDVLAIRPRLAQRVGVQVTGTAQAPFVRLYAEPDLPEAEKLSWLVLGRAAAAGGAETALLQSAALALLQSRTGTGGGKGPAALLGLDELGFRREGAEGPAVTLGKRLGRNLYASYERSLTGALGTLFVFYDLSQRLTVRAQAGERAAVDLIFTFAYD